MGESLRKQREDEGTGFGKQIAYRYCLVVRRLHSILLLLGCLAQAGRGEEPVTGWKRMLDEMVARAEAENQPAVEVAVAEQKPVFELPKPQVTGVVAAAMRIFEEEGVGAELVWLGQVESGFNPNARSPKGAAGIWQLMPDTARHFGLQVGALDERFDFEKSTRVAARYLRMLFAKFGDLELALAAYNAGEGRVEKALRATSERTFRGLALRNLLPKETRDYVPAVLAAQNSRQVKVDELERNTIAETTNPTRVLFARHGFLN